MNVIEGREVIEIKKLKYKIPTRRVDVDDFLERKTVGYMYIYICIYTVVHKARCCPPDSDQAIGGSSGVPSDVLVDMAISSPQLFTNPRVARNSKLLSTHARDVFSSHNVSPSNKHAGISRTTGSKELIDQHSKTARQQDSN